MMQNLVSHLFLGVLLFCFPLVGPAQNAPFTLRVNAGETAEIKDKIGNVWKPDRGYSPGNEYGFQGGNTVDRGPITIQGTDDPRIYQTEHYSMVAFIAEVPKGVYTVRLHFAETFARIDSRGLRIFDVKIQGVEVLKGLDVMKTAGGMNRALVEEFRGIAAMDGKLQIDFVPHQQNPMVNGIEILAEK